MSRAREFSLYNVYRNDNKISSFKHSRSSEQFREDIRRTRAISADLFHADARLRMMATTSPIPGPISATFQSRNIAHERGIDRHNLPGSDEVSCLIALRVQKLEFCISSEFCANWPAAQSSFLMGIGIHENVIVSSLCTRSIARSDSGCMLAGWRNCCG